MCDSDIVRAEDLGLSAGEVRRRWPQAVEYLALDGSPCWRRAELTDREARDGAGEVGE
jgi:hypothetical protein